LVLNFEYKVTGNNSGLNVSLVGGKFGRSCCYGYGRGSEVTVSTVDKTLEILK
jgi:hypothetical protein